MTRICFIVPPYVSYEAFTGPSFSERVSRKKSGTFGSVVTDMPIGLLSIAAYLKAQGPVDIRILDFNVHLAGCEEFTYPSFAAMYTELLAEIFSGFVPDIIGLSCLFTPSFQNMLDLADGAAHLCPDALIVAGGGIPANMPDRVFAGSNAVAGICYGEGERPLSDLIAATDRARLLQSHPTWITRESLQADRKPVADLIVDLDEIPPYDYSLVKASDYALNPTINLIASFEKKETPYYYATSRGCPYRCCFCASHAVHGRKMRFHSLSRVEHELRRCKEDFGATAVCFQDDHFLADRDRSLQIIEIVRKLELTVFFQSGLALNALNREVLEALHRAGVKHLVLAVESGSERVLRDIMHKPLTLSMVNEVVGNCRDLGIQTDANILVGLPGETMADIEDARQFLQTVDANWFRIYIATPLVGSEMYEICERNGFLVSDHVGSDFKRPVIETDAFTPERIQEIAYDLNLDLNFVHNSDMRLGNFLAARQSFENTLRVKEDHALGHYFLARCCRQLGERDAEIHHQKRCREIVSESDFWEEQMTHYNLKPLPAGENDGS